MSDQQTIERLQQEVVSGNKDRLYQATSLERVKNIFKNSNGLDNISKEDMKFFRDFMYAK